MNIKARWGLCIFLAVLFALGSRGASAQSEGAVYFPDTGHWVTGDFLTFYERVPDPYKLYGFPISEAFPESGTGRMVQYFQKARFILDPRAVEALRVQLSPLGELLYSPGVELPHSSSFPACRTFSETGFEICYAFLDFFNQNGDLAQFGYPISNFEIQDGLIVQYFQRARFEWHPELPSGQRVVLSDLGLQYFKVAGEDPNRLLPNIENNLPQSILELRVKAFIDQAVIRQGENQTLFVIIQDQNLRPVPRVQVGFSVNWPSGETETYSMSPTDENGITSARFQVRTGPTGLTQVAVTAQFNALKEQTLTSFRIWW